MATNKVYKFRDIVEAELFLNGAILGGGNADKGYAVVGKKLHFTAPGPVGTVTFTTGTNPNDPYTLYLKDVKTQVETAVAGIKVFTKDNRIVFTSSTGVVLHPTGAADDANAAFGFDPLQDVVGKVYTPVDVSATPPCWTWAGISNENMHVLFTWE
jgi:hypothetical protein